MEHLGSVTSHIPESVKIAALPILTSATLHAATIALHEYGVGENKCNHFELTNFLKYSLCYCVPSLILAAASSAPIGSWPQLTSSDLSFRMKVMFGTATAAAALIGIYRHYNLNDKDYYDFLNCHKNLKRTEKQTRFLISALNFLRFQLQYFIPTSCLALSVYALGKRYSLRS